MKKMWWLAALLALPLVSAAPGDVIGGVWNIILSIGGLSFLQGFGLVSFTRILLAILSFTLFFAVLSVLPADKEGKPRFIRKHAIVMAAILAIMSAIFLPAAAILAVGAGWATAVGLILIGTPVLGLGYTLWRIPGKDKTETKGTVIFKLVVSMLLFWILSAMNYSLQAERGLTIGSASVTGTMANFIAWALYISSLMIIWYIVKFFFTSSGSKEGVDQQWKEGGKSLGNWLGKKMEAQKEKEQMQRRDNLLKPTRSYLINAIEGSQGLITALFGGVRTPEDKIAAVSKAEKQWKFLKKNLKLAVRDLRRLRRREKGKTYEVFDTLYAHAATALTVAKNLSLPKSNDEEWETKRAAVYGMVMNQVRGICGGIINAIDQFIEQEKVEFARLNVAQQTQQQVQERTQQRDQRQEAVQQRAQEQVQQKRPVLRPRAVRKGRR